MFKIELSLQAGGKKITPAQLGRYLENHAKKKLSYALEGKMVEEMGAMAVEAIKERTRRGIDVDGKPFPPYSESYRREKAASKGGFAAVGGSLLDAIRFRRTGKNSGVIEIADRKIGKLSARRLAQIHINGEGKMPRRAFFGWRTGSPEDRKLRRKAAELLRRSIK